MIEVNAPAKTVAITYVLFELTATGEQKLVSVDKKAQQYISDGFAEDWIAEHGDKNKTYIVQRCLMPKRNK